MPNNHLQLVNQKLAFADSIIASLMSASGNFANTEKLKQQALADAAVFHLATALHFYVRELAEAHRVSNIQRITSIRDLAIALDKTDKVSSEVSELVEMEGLTDSWLNRLTYYYDQLFRSPEKVREKKAFGRENMIDAIELAGNDGPVAVELTAEVLVCWLTSFRSLIVRHRETSAEY